MAMRAGANRIAYISDPLNSVELCGIASVSIPILARSRRILLRRTCRCNPCLNLSTFSIEAGITDYMFLLFYWTEFIYNKLKFSWTFLKLHVKPILFFFYFSLILTFYQNKFCKDSAQSLIFTIECGKPRDTSYTVCSSKKLVRISHIRAPPDFNLVRPYPLTAHYSQH